ncbi:MAG: ATP-binding protein [Bacteroidota bacterium]
MRRSVILTLITIFCYGYSIGQVGKAIKLPSNWSELTSKEQLKEALNIVDTLKNGIKRKQFIDNFTNTIKDEFILAEAFTSFGEEAESKNNLSEAENLYFQALRIKRNIQDQEEIGRGLFRVGYILLTQGKQKESIEYFLESEAIFKENESYARLSTVYITMGEAYYKIGDYDKGLERLERGLNLSTQHDYEYGQACALLNMSELYIKMGTYDIAILKAKECIPIFEKLEANENAAIANMNIGSAYFYKNENKEASKYYKRALSYEGIGITTKAKILNNLSTISLEDEKYEDALNIYLDLLKNDTYIESEELIATTNFNVGNLYYRVNKYVAAKKHLAMAEDIATKNNNLRLQSEAMQLMAYNYYFLKQPDKALEYNSNWAKVEQERKEEYTDAMNLGMNQLSTEKLVAEQKQQQNLIFALLSIIIGIIGIFIAIFYAYRQRNKRKMAEQEKLQAEKEKQQKINEVLRDSELKTVRARLEGIDEERDRISKDLHDSVGMMMTSTQLHFEALGKKLNKIEVRNRERFNTAFDLLKETQKETRRVIHDMASQTLVKHGLVAQIEELVSKIKTTGTIDVKLNVKGINTDTKWNSSLEMKVYKIVQELINNALKHAKADTLDIQIQQIEDELSLRIEDDGQGFDKDNADIGMGMRTIKDRVKDLGGQVNFQSTTGSGTIVSIEHIHLN